jgi:osmotically inducible lipoprotein OsmB
MSNRLKWTSIATLLVLASLTTGCTLGGAAAGGVVGNEATNHSTAGTVGGAVAGGVIGYELGK